MTPQESVSHSPSDMIEGSHKCSVTNCYGDWRIHEITMKGTISLKLTDIQHLLTEDKLQTLNLSDVAWKGKHLPDKFVGENCICCGGERFLRCDVRFPGIVLVDVNNPYGNKYRLIDGKHRAHKLSSSGHLTSKFYVLHLSEVKPHFVLK